MAVSDVKIPRSLVQKYAKDHILFSSLVILLDKIADDGQITMRINPELTIFLGITYSQARRVLDILSKEGIIQVVGNNRSTTIALCDGKKEVAIPAEKWRSCRLVPKVITAKDGTERPPTWKEALEIVLEPRRKKFVEELREFVDTYGKDMCNDFFRYWTEPANVKEGCLLTSVKMRFEQQKTWELSRRLITWNNNNKK